MNGVLIINKPSDYTSFDVVAVIRKLSGQKKIGHTGTLDPMATGVLPLLLGSAAKAQGILPETNKKYIAGFRMGIATDTLDITGTVTEKYDCNFTKDELLNAIENFKGEQQQIPPMYSAVKKNGKKLYELARQGIEVERESRKIFIYKLNLLEYNENDFSGLIEVECSKGTYIRSLICDIGRYLNCSGIMTSLCRINACGYDISQSIKLDDIRKLFSEENKCLKSNPIENMLLPTESIFSNYRYVQVSEAQSKRFSNGGNLSLERTALKSSYTDGEIIRVKSQNGKFLGLGIIDLSLKELKIYKLFCD